MSTATATEEFLPATQSELCRWMSENAGGAALPIYPAGGRTAIHYGPALSLPGISLCTTGLARVIDYPARDMTVTVESGIRMDDLVNVLEREGQRVPIDVPQAHRATLGGVVASNTSGSRRFGLGTMRDYVIGISAVDAAGRAFKAGGRVVKNVAGYDLCKMLVGSMGTLAVISQLTLKLRPIPESSKLLWATFQRMDAVEQVLQRLVTSGTRPMALELLDTRAASAIAAEAGISVPMNHPVLCIGVEGSDRETAWQIETLQSEISPAGPLEIAVVQGGEATKLEFALTEFQVPSDDPLTFKANLLPSRTVAFVAEAERAGCALQAHAGNGIVVGHLPDSVTTAHAAAEVLAQLRNQARQCRGNIVVEQCDPGWKGVLPVNGEPESSWPLMRKLKNQLDPQNLLNPHRVF